VNWNFHTEMISISLVGLMGCASLRASRTCAFSVAHQKMAQHGTNSFLITI